VICLPDMTICFARYWVIFATLSKEWNRIYKSWKLEKCSSCNCFSDCYSL